MMGVVVATRIPILLIGWFAALTIGLASPAAPYRVARGAIADLPARFDAIAIARAGLDRRSPPPDDLEAHRLRRVFPVYPWVVAGVGRLVPWPHASPESGLVKQLWVGTVVSIAAFAAAMIVLGAFARAWIGPDASKASKATMLLLAVSPFAAIFSAAYPESLYLLCAVSAFWAMHRGETTRAALWGLLAGAGVSYGCLLGLALAGVDSARPASDGRRSSRAARAVAMSAPVVGMLLASAVMAHTAGGWFLWRRPSASWATLLATAAPVQGWWLSRGLFDAIARQPEHSIQVAVVVFYLWQVVAVTRRLGPWWAAFSVATLAMAWATGGVASAATATATLFPVPLALSSTFSRDKLVAWSAVMGMLQGVIAVLFFTWRPIV